MQNSENIFRIAETYNMKGFMMLFVIILGMVFTYLLITVIHDVLKKGRLRELKNKIEERHQLWLYGG